MGRAGGRPIVIWGLRQTGSGTGILKCGIKDWCENQCRFVVLLYKTTCFDGELHSSSEGRVWWEDIANLPNLKLSLDMRDMLRVFKEENLSEFFYYQESSAWKYVLK